MAIIFENIDTGDSIAVDRETGGKFYHAKLSALMNSSNMGINADRGQDYGWRLKPEQQALIEAWEEDPDTIDKVSQFTKVPLDSLTHSEFLSYMLHLQEAGRSPEKALAAARRESQAAYDARVAALKASVKPEAMLPFEYSEESTQPVTVSIDNAIEDAAEKDANDFADLAKTVSKIQDRPVKKNTKK